MSSSERILAALATHEPRHDRRVDHALPVDDPPQRVDEHGDVEDPLLQQVADALRMVLEQPHRVGRLEVLRENEHADPRVLRADACRRPEPFVGVRGRHPDVDDRDVRLVGCDHPQEPVAITGLADDVDIGLTRAGGRCPRA